jgi:hypothetical protein
MNAKNWKLQLFVVVVACLGIVSVANAASIGVNFEGGSGNTTNSNGPSVTGSAGAVPMINWNNEPGFSQLTPVNIVDNSSLVAGTLTYNSGNVYGATPSGGGTSGGAGDTALMTGYLDNFNGGTLTVGNLGTEFTSKGYEILVYQNGDGNGSFGFSATDNSGHSDTRYGQQTGGNGGNYPLVGGVNGYIGSTSTNPAGPGTAADYVILTGFTGSSFTLTGLSGTTGDGRAKLDGFEIIANTPEPGSIAALVGMGGMGLVCLVIRRRRRKA